MTRPPVVVLQPHHDRSTFRCGVDALDPYLAEQASQDARRGAATIFVVADSESATILGYYTLSMASILLDRLPSETARRMPRYPTLPAVRLGRLAVHLDARGTGLGQHLLLDAMARALRTEIAWTAFLVDAKDESAARFYARYGFRPLTDAPQSMYLMRKTIEPLLRQG